VFFNALENFGKNLGACEDRAVAFQDYQLLVNY
jgi:hypothetical protein